MTEPRATVGAPGAGSLANDLARELARMKAECERYRQALRRIAITDDADCKIAYDPKAMTKIARAALDEQGRRT